MRLSKDNLIYDTIKSTRIITLDSMVKGEKKHLYRTKEGNWFLHVTQSSFFGLIAKTDKDIIPLEDADVMKLFKEQREYDLLEKYFGVTPLEVQ